MAEGTWSRVTVVLTDDSLIRALNARHLQRLDSTDVLSFDYPPMPGFRRSREADIVVNVERAVAEGRSRPRWSPDRELALYIAHGCNHLTGADDNTPAARRRMRRRELRWLAKASLRGLTDRLLPIPPVRHPAHRGLQKTHHAVRGRQP